MMQGITRGAVLAMFAGTLAYAGWSMSASAGDEATKPPQQKARDESAPPAGEPALDTAVLEKVGEACWSELRTRRIYFAHQAIGSEMLTGMRELMRRKPAMNLEVVAYEEPDTTDGTVHSVFDAPGIVEATAGRRGNPEGKIEDFSKFLRSSDGAKVDIALLKLCYGDIGRMTDAEALFNRYTKAIEEVRRERPNIHFIHCTVPLKAEEHGAKGRFKRLVGAGSDASNATRSRYNELLRARFPEAQVLDIAAVQSRRPDGTVATVEVGGKRVQTLADEYTDDGAHLNRLGELVVAREFLLTLSHQCGGEAERVTAGGKTTTSAEPGDRE